MAKRKNHSSGKRELSDTEQQLKAANQQLRASEQQLRAANQQLRATEQQLRADIVERKRAEEALRESEERYRILTENSLTGIFINQDGRYVFVNDRFAEIHGYRSKELLGKDYLGLIHPDERQKVSQIVADRLKGKEATWRYEVRRLKKDREIIWCEMMAGRIEYRGRPAIMGNIVDITERKQVEEALRAANQQLRANEQQLKAANQQLRASEQQLKATNQQLRANERQLLDDQAQLKQLASQLTLAEESERHRIATELHATISQSLVVSKLQLDTLRATAHRDIAKTLGEVCESLDETIQGTKSLTFDLSSPILYELGFETAVAEWLTERIRQKHGIATEFEDDGQPKPLDDEVCVFLFRDVRELLINVVKHAQANKVKVSIRKVGRQIQVSVEDDGRGFDPEKVVAMAVRKGGFGLFSIRERLGQLGGHLEIESAPGQGAKVTIMAPLKGEKNAEGR